MKSYLFHFAASLLIACAPTVVLSDRALIIGVNDYAIKPLRGAINDMELMETLVRDEMGFPAEDIKTLADEQATYLGITAAIEDWLIRGTKSGDRALLYFAGHGTQVSDFDGDEGIEGLDEAIAPWDYLRDSDELITDDLLGTLLSQLDDRKVTVIVDACNSGTITRSVSNEPSPIGSRYLPISVSEQPGATRSANAFPAAALQDKGMIDGSVSKSVEVWTASAAYQDTFEVEINGNVHGIFTHSLASALRANAADENKSGKVSRGKVLASVRASASSICALSDICMEQGSILTPTLQVAPQYRALPIAQWASSTGVVPSTLRPDVLDILVGGAIDMQLQMLSADGIETATPRRGDPIYFKIVSPVEGELIMLDVRDSAVTRLHPGPAFGALTRVPANEAITLPDAYDGINFVPPSGAGTIVAIVVADGGLINDFTASTRGLEVVSEPLDRVSSLMDILSGVWSGDAENRPISFGVAKIKYYVE